MMGPIIIGGGGGHGGGGAVSADEVAYRNTNVAAALAAISPPEGPDFVIDEMTRGSREPYIRPPFLPEGLAVVQEGDIVANALPIKLSGQFENDLSVDAPAGMTFTVTDQVGRDEANATVNFSFMTSGETVSVADRIPELNAALAAAGICLVLVNQPDFGQVIALCGKWTGVQDAAGEGLLRMSGTLADAIGISGSLQPTKRTIFDANFNAVRLNGGYRSWSKVTLFADGGGIYQDGQLYLPDVSTHPWITFGVAVNRPGVPGELDVIVRNASIVAADTTPPMTGGPAEPIKEFVDTRGLVFIPAV